MSTTSTLKQGLLVGLVSCVLAAACSSEGGRGEQPAAPDISIADNDTTTTTTQGVAEPTTTTTQGVAEPSTTAEAEPTTTGDSDADITTTTTVEATTTTVPATTDVISTETTTSATQPATTEATITTEPSTSAPSTTAPADTTTNTTTSVQLEVSQNVVCGKRLVKLDEFVTETDNGCRQADCLGGRNDQTGRCVNWWEWADTLDRECPTVDTSDGLGAMGTLVPSLEISPSTFPQMVAGSSWVADIQLVDNDNWDWKPGGVAPTDGRKYFIMFLTAAGYPPKVGEEQKRTSQLFSTDDPEGSWRVPFSIHEKQPLDPAFGLGATPQGAGCWSVRFTRTG